MIKGYECKLCGKKYQQKENILRHIQTKHEIQETVISRLRDVVRLIK